MDISTCDLTNDDSVNRERVATFPYANLIQINPTDLGTIRCVLPSLLKITQHEMFYGNSKAVKCVLDFVTDVLHNCNTPESKNEFVMALLLLNNILSGLKSANKIEELCTGFIEFIFQICAYDNFCVPGSTYCVNMVLLILEDMSDNCVVFDEKIAKIIDNLIRVSADSDIATLTPTVLYRYPVSSETYLVYSKWLMHTAIQLLENSNFDEGVQEEKPTLAIILRAVAKLLFESLKLARSGSVNIPDVKTFWQNVTNQVHKIIHLCCVPSVKRDSRSILELILLKFLDDQHIKGKENICEEVEKLPEVVAEWPNCTCKTFFWLCHLVYYTERIVWSSSAICIAISRLLYKPKYRILIDGYVLKSLLFVFPITLSTESNRKKKLIIGNELRDIILPEFKPIISDVLSLHPLQLKWILSKFPAEYKIAVVKFWLKNCEPQHFAVLEVSLLESKSHDLLINILMECPNDSRAIQLIENLEGQVTFKDVHVLIDQHNNNTETCASLLKVFCRVVPQNQIDAFKLLTSIREVLMMTLDDETLTNALLLVNNLLNCLKSNQRCVTFLVEDEFWFKLLLSEFKNSNEKLVKTVLETFILLLSHCGTCKVKILAFDLTYALSMSVSVAEKAVQFLMLALRTEMLKPKKSTICNVFSQLCSLTVVGKVIPDIYGVLKVLLQRNEELIFAPSVGLLIEQQYSFSHLPNFPSYCQQFILYWIELVHSRKSMVRMIYNLPPKMLLVKFLQRFRDIGEIGKYVQYVDEIYD